MRKNVLVLVDGMYSSRSLTTINPDDVESVEVITNPRVEYDSEVANVLNIILKVEHESLMESEKDVEQRK
ncbi:MAG: TonB-dependent receptor plug domain-containing protein [Bacteroidales bacterium]|nr:TonB-dependent receptor plug domain-containing protein [Bacteroidales bacterium]